MSERRVEQRAIAADVEVVGAQRREPCLGVGVDAEVGGQLAERGAEAALNLIKARLAELRGEWGEVEFALAAGIEPPAPE